MNLFFALDAGTVYREYYRKVYNYVYGQLRHREAAEDVTADVFAAVLEKSGQFRGRDGAGLSSWIFSVARNMTIDYQRRASFHREESVWIVPEKTSEMMGWTKADNSLRESENPAIRRIMEKLSKEERILIELRYGLGLTNDEVAGIMDMKANTVSHRYARLLEKCRKIAGDPGKNF